MADNKVTIEVAIEGNAKAQFKKLTNSVDTFEKQTKKSFLNSGRIFDNFIANVASNVTSKAFSALSSAVSASAANFLRFDAAIAEVNSLLPVNVKLTNQTTAALIKFSSSFGTTAESQAKAFYQTVSAGITDSADALELLQIANRAAAAGVTDVEVAVNALTNAVNVFGAGGLAAAEASDILFVAVREGKTTFDELGASMGKVTSLANSAGVSFAEIAGTLSFATKAGINTRQAVTGLRAALGNIIKITPQQTKTAKDLGIEFNATALSAKGLAGFLSDVRNATKGNTEELAKLFPSIEAVNIIAAITGDSFEEFNRILGETQDATGATDAAFAKIEESLSFRVKRLEASFVNLGLKIVASLEPALSILVKIGTEAIDILTREQTELQKTANNTGFLGFKVDELREKIREKSDVELALNEKLRMDVERTGQNAVGVQLETDRQLAELRELSALEQLAVEENAKFKEDADASKSLAKFAANLNTRNALLKAAGTKGSADEIKRNNDLLKQIEQSNRASTNTKLAISAKFLANDTKLQQERLAVTKGTLGSISTLTRAKTKELAAIGKAAAIAQATINTFEGATKALAQLGIFGPPAAALIVVAGLAQVANIAGIPLQTGLTQVPQGFNNDTFSARLSTGERVVSAPQNQDLTGFLASSEGLGEKLDTLIELTQERQSITVNVGGREIIDVIQDEIDSGRSLNV